MADISRGKTFASDEEVTNTKLHDLVDEATVTNIGTADIVAGAVTEDKIADGNVTEVKIADGSITFAKMSSALLDVIYPIGYVVTLGVSTNPGTLFGVGTWAAIEGRVIVGIAGSGTFDTLNEELGAETVTLTSAQSGLPAHTHAYLSVYKTGEQTINRGGSGTSAANPVSNTSSANTTANAAEAHTNLQPSITKYVWERTA